MSHEKSQPLAIYDKWKEENDKIVKDLMKLKTLSSDQTLTVLRCGSELYQLLSRIQGFVFHEDNAELELSVVINVSICLIAQSQFLEAEQILTQSLTRVLQIQCNGTSSQPVLFWRTVLSEVEKNPWRRLGLYIFSLQWAIWLATCRIKIVMDFKKEMDLIFECLSCVADNGSPKLVMDPRRLLELLQITTAITQGAEMLVEGSPSEALACLQAAATMPAPRVLAAHVQFLSGSCFAQMSRPQLALVCYKRALETDFGCLCALYQSSVVYKLQENLEAEIQALRILYSSLMLPDNTERTPGTSLFSPSLLLSSKPLTILLSTPSLYDTLYRLARKCVLHGRVQEGVDHFLDLLAAFRSEEAHRMHLEVSTLPKLPGLYLEVGAALLMAQRPAECATLCSEVIETATELLPEKLFVEEAADDGFGDGEEKEDNRKKLKMLQWVAAAHLLQGHCFTLLRDWKLAIDHYARCVNLTLKVHIKRSAQSLTANTEVKSGSDLCILSRLKALSLAGKGISFAQMQDLTKALGDLQLSLQVLPGGVGAGLWCGEVLWRLGRKQEAATCLKKTWNFPTQEFAEDFPLYAREYQVGPSLDVSELRCRIQKLGMTTLN